MKKQLVTRLLLLTVTAAAFSAITFAQAANKLSVDQWRLTDVNGRRVANSKAFIEINNNRNRFQGNTGCNQMFGRVSVIGRRIQFSDIGTTRMACIGEANRIEREVVNTLKRVTRYRQFGDRLELYQRNRVVMGLTAIVRDFPSETRFGLEDRKWMLQQIGNQVNIRALPEAFIDFDATKRSAGGNSSCNVFGGSYSLHGRDRIQITDVVSTMRACIEDYRMTVERQFLDGLRDANRYEIRDGMLRLYRDRKLLLTFRGVQKR